MVNYIRVWFGAHSAEYLGISLATLAAAAVFVFDLTFPLGVAGAVPYILVVLICSWLARCPVYWAAAACSVLTVLGYFFSPAGGDPTVVLINRALALFAIWVTALLVSEQARAKKSLAHVEGTLSTSNARFGEFIHSSNWLSKTYLWFPQTHQGSTWENGHNERFRHSSQKHPFLKP